MDEEQITAFIKRLFAEGLKFMIAVEGAQSFIHYRPASDTWTTSLGHYGRGIDDLIKLAKGDHS